jgi:hypothetical protein
MLQQRLESTVAAAGLAACCEASHGGAWARRLAAVLNNGASLAAVMEEANDAGTIW